MQSTCNPFSDFVSAAQQAYFPIFVTGITCSNSVHSSIPMGVALGQITIKGGPTQNETAFKLVNYCAPAGPVLQKDIPLRYPVAGIQIISNQPPVVVCPVGTYVYGFDKDGVVRCGTYSIYKNMPKCHPMATRSPTLSSDPNNNYPCIYTQNALMTNSGANQITTTPMVGAPDTRAATSTKCPVNQIQNFFAFADLGSSSFGIQCVNKSGTLFTDSYFGQKSPPPPSLICPTGSTFSSLDVYSSDTQIVGYEMKCSNNTSVTRGETGGGGASTLSCAGAGTPANPAYPVGVTVKQNATAVTQLGLICGQWIMPAN